MGRSVRRVATEGLTPDEIRELRALFTAAWPASDEEPFTDDDWQHAVGGVHVLAEESGRIVAHASVVPRSLEVGGVQMRTGYVEAVATWPDLERQGHGSALMREIDAIIEADYELGVLGTGAFAFYERLGWEHWRGPTSVRTVGGLVRTPEDDAYIMVRRTPSTPRGLDLEAPIICEWRPGDVW
jgi:aminoglycoside 2'-N-acetyltransferase I